jgi:large subunit ribosomal protein L3
MKVGMLPVWDKWGRKHAATVLQLDNCQVVQVKTDDTNGYTALQLGVGEAKLKNVRRAQKGHYEKNNLIPNRKLWEFRVTPDALLTPGTKVHADHFVAGQLVDVCGKSKGKGFQGVMKRWGFRGGFATHGASVSHRVPGSTGCRQDPGRVFKGKKMPGRKGNKRVTVQNLLVLKVSALDITSSLLFLLLFLFLFRWIPVES